MKKGNITLVGFINELNLQNVFVVGVLNCLTPINSGYQLNYQVD